jgi:hypothetical protein
MANDHIYNSPVPPNWKELPQVTVIHHGHKTVSFAVLEKTGRLYHHLRYLFPGERLEPNNWVAQIPIEEVTLVPGLDKKLKNRAMKWKAETQAHENKLREAFWEIDRQSSEEKRNKQAALEAEWREANPPPPTPRFLNPRRLPRS